MGSFGHLQYKVTPRFILMFLISIEARLIRPIFFFIQTRINFMPFLTGNNDLSRDGKKSMKMMSVKMNQ